MLDPARSNLEPIDMLAGTKNSLSAKIIGILVVFFLAALASITLTLFMSWQLKGASAALNDTGSLRMKVYQMGYELSQMNLDQGLADASDARLGMLVARFDQTLHDLEHGVPSRPLFIPKGDGIPEGLDQVILHWVTTVRPVLSPANEANLAERLDHFARHSSEFVAEIDALVRKMEVSFAQSTNILQMSQVVLVLLAVVGTLALIRFFFVQVIRPVGELAEGVEKWGKDDFSYRLVPRSDDELGRLASGFNRSASHLQYLYATLEDRVREKTRSLSEKNRQLQILYSVSDFLNDGSDVDAVCRGFLKRVIDMLDAQAGAIRLLDSEGANLCFTFGQGLSEDFIENEAVLRCGDCLCGVASSRNASFIANTEPREFPLTRDVCRQAGFNTVSASSVVANKRPMGVFNLFFSEGRTLAESDRQLLETLGQQLGAALDGLRLQARARELAVSEERNLLARELHDSIAQALAFMNLQVQMLESSVERNDDDEVRSGLALLQQGLQESYEDVRELMVHFRAKIGEHDLDTGIADALKRLSAQTGIVSNMDVQGGGAPLDPETETQLLYIVQEAISNVRKHADARTVNLRLRRGLDGLTVQIRDDGKGFAEDGGESVGTQEHIGLQVMRERAQRVGAMLSIKSKPGKGTEVMLTVPRVCEEGVA